MSATVHAVLAGAYRGGRASLRRLLTHAVVDGHVLCRKVAFERLCDLAENGPPTCPMCAARMARRLTAASSSHR